MDTEQTIKQLQGQMESLQQSVDLPTHYHNGFDSNQVSFVDLNQKKLYLSHTIYGDTTTVATNYGVFFIAPMKCVLTKAYEVHQGAGSAAGAVTVTIEKLTGTQALDAGVVMLDSAFNLKGTANTVQTGTITKIMANSALATGNRLALRDVGTLTDVSNVTITLELTF